MIPSFNLDGEPTELYLTGYYSLVTLATLISPRLLKRESNIIFNGFHDALYDRQSGVHIATVHWTQDISCVTLRPTEVTSSLVMYTVPYETIHRRLIHAHAEKVLKACADNGIKVSKSEAL